MQINMFVDSLAEVISGLSEGDEITVYQPDPGTIITSVVYDVIRSEIVITNTGRVIRPESPVIVSKTGKRHSSYPVCEKAIKNQIRLKYYLPDTPSPASEPE